MKKNPSQRPKRYLALWSLALFIFGLVVFCAFELLKEKIDIFIFSAWMFLSWLLFFIAFKIRESEEKVVETQHLYQTLLEEAADGIILLNPEGVILSVNRAALTFSGYAEEDLVGRHFATISALTEQSRQKIVEEYPRIITGEKRPPMNLQVYHKSGKNLYFEANASRIEKSHGDFCVQAIMRDVTLRLENEETLQQTQLNYLTVFNAVTDAIMIYESKTGNILDVNQKLCELFGYSREEILQMALIEFSSGRPPYDQVSIARLLARVAQGERVPLFEWEAKRRDGSLFWIEVGLQVTQINGRDCVLSIIHNINDRKLAQEALRKEKERAQNYLNIAGTMIVALNREQRITLINKRGCELLGYEESELIGQDWFEQCLPEHVKSSVKMIFTQLISGQGEYFQYAESHIKTKNGNERLIAWHNTLIRDEQGSITGIISSGEDITEQRTTEEALKQQFYFLQRLIDTIPSPIFYQNIRGEYLGCNVAFQNFIGRYKEDIIRKTAYDLVSKNVADVYYEMDQALLREGGIQIYENEIKLGDTIRNVVFNKAMYYNADGSVAGIVGVVQDITERKRIEENIKMVQQQQRAILDNIPDIAWLKDKDSRFIAVNAPLAKLCGMSADKLAGKTDFDIFPKDLAEHYRTDDLDVMESGRGKLLEEQIIDKDGQTRWIETIKTPICADDGQVIGTAGIARDITIRRNLEQDLLNLSHAVKQSSASIVITDIKGNIEYVNQKFTDVTGYSYKEVLGQNPRILKSGVQPPEVYKQMWSAIVAGKDWRGEFLNKKKNGELFWEAVLMSPVKDNDGKIVRYLAVKEEITQRKQMEQTVARMNQELAQEDVKLRQALFDLEKKNKELRETQEKLLQTEKMAAIGQLSAGIAHEIKNPLSIILLGLDQIEQIVGSQDKTVNTHIGMIKRASERADKVITDLLNFARQTSLTLGLVDIHEIIDSALTLVQNAGKLKNIKFVRHFAKGPLKVKADKILLEHAFVNILANAVDAIEEKGEITVTSIQEKNGEGRDSVRIEIQDTGCGMSAEVAAHVFEPFFTTKEVGHGTGLGLSTVYKILERHKGSIDVKSKIDTGTTFILRIPQ